MRLAAFLWMVAGAAWALEGNSVGGLYEEHFPPIHPNCTQSLTDLLLLRQEVQLQELKQAEHASAEILKEILTVIKAGTPCPGNYTKVGATCLHLAKDTDVTWEDARLFCQEMGGDLAVFRDANAYADAVGYIKDIISIPSAKVWLGGNDLIVEGEWKWITGVDMPRGIPFWGIYNNAPEPNGGVGENCAILHGSYGLEIHDVSCGWHCKPLCQI
ncbi:CD209 antigen-like isoform X2 [Penaeus japonicus]|uniref:CD209 antigen-like isoform X2 n=1 Tax=Penaeus japonicus TaxID=27405 RepID=UPI001C716E9B|nr:CD209 antigen-like isoform X2 [Penaeus japonicus]